MRRTTTTKGFTLAEILVVLAIISIVALISLSGLQGLRDFTALRAGGGEVYAALVSARERTLASDDDSVYGVHIASTSVTRFIGATYAPSATSNITYTFEAGVTATGTLVTSGVNITFTRLTGEPSATGTVYVRNAEGSSTSTITVNGSGLIEYE